MTMRGQTVRAALSASDLAEYLGIGRTKAYELMHSQGFPSVCIRTEKGRGSMRVMRPDLDKWISERRVNHGIFSGNPACDADTFRKMMQYWLFRF